MALAFYNEIDEFCQQWLQNLMNAGEIPMGVIDGRDIRDIKPRELVGFTQYHFFAGLGGWARGLRLAGWPDDRPVATGSCPCQPYSQAGLGAGFADERHLWPAWFHLIDICGFPIVLGEQVTAAIKHGWLDLVQDDMEGIGYAFAPVGLPAGCIAPHNRPRVWFVADAVGGLQSWQESCRREIGRVGRELEPLPWNRAWQEALREFRAVDDGFSYGVDATDAARNAIVPQVAEILVRAYQEVRGW